jgi:hypothetical protein
MAGKCSGAMSAGHSGRDERDVRLSGRTVAMCRECRDAAGRLGLIDRREVER